MQIEITRMQRHRSYRLMLKNKMEPSRKAGEEAEHVVEVVDLGQEADEDEHDETRDQLEDD